MPVALDLSQLGWTLTGWRPFAWRLRKAAETGGFLLPDHGPYPARLPGSVQGNLLRAGAIPDWNIGRNSLAVEWVEHRHWMFTATLPPVSGEAFELVADGLDHNGWIVLDGAMVGTFDGAHLPVRVPLPPGPGDRPRELAIIFGLPPEGQGQLGHTSLAREAKPRYNFGWDWCVRLVPIGATGGLRLERPTAPALSGLRLRATLDASFAHGEVTVNFLAGDVQPGDELQLTIGADDLVRAEARVALLTGENAVRIPVLAPALWWPNGEGPQTLHAVRGCVRRAGEVVDEFVREVGFKHVVWRACAGAPDGALEWLCVVNGRPLFLQGVNWTPVRLCYQDVTVEETERLVGLYRELGCNLLRVWGGGFLESTAFYAACDRAGLLVWQEFPLSSSGLDSRPPEDEAFVAGLVGIARHFIRSRQHHACLLLWCGGNELHRDVLHGAGTRREPLDLGHRALAALAELVAAEDPGRRFVPTSPYGPRFHATREEFGRGLHHEVHGPWGLDAFPGDAWERYWRDDDSLFRGEVGVAGASRPELIRRFSGGEEVWPPDNALWRHASGWWTQWDRLGGAFAAAEPTTVLEDFTACTRREQAEKLAFAVRAAKARFPACGGFLVWMGHDAFPCLANTSIVEYDHTPKPAAHAVAAVFRERPSLP